MAKIKVIEKSEIAIKTLRNQRNDELKNSDWTQFNDSPLTDVKKSEWQTYRQALRDITTQTPSLDADGNLTGVNWPTPPTN